MSLSMKIPDDILMEILARLPADSLMRFKCVSKLWSSLISSRYFTNLFFKFSSLTKRERVFVYTYDNKLFSSSGNNLNTTSSLVQLNRDLTLPGIEDRLHFVNALRGLMCFRIGREIQIINFTTRQVLKLPLVESEKAYASMWNYFGYDHVNDEYKVLSIIESKAQILVLGAGASWRETRSRTSPPLPYSPDGHGISINNVLYYVARSHENIFVLMSFDFNSEEFNLIEFPREIIFYGSISLVNLINYQGRLALSDCYYLNTESTTLDLWVAAEDEGKSKWSRKVFVLPYGQLKLSLELDIFDVMIRSTSRGKVTLCGSFVNTKNKKITHAFYDLEKNRIIKGFFFEPPYPIFGFLGFWATSLWDDVESIMFLEA